MVCGAGGFISDPGDHHTQPCRQLQYEDEMPAATNLRRDLVADLGGVGGGVAGELRAESLDLEEHRLFSDGA